MFRIRQVLEKGVGIRGVTKNYASYTDFQKSCVFIKSEYLFDILIKVTTVNYLSSTFPIENCLKQGDALSLLFNFSLDYALRKAQEIILVLDVYSLCGCCQLFNSCVFKFSI